MGFTSRIWDNPRVSRLRDLWVEQKSVAEMAEEMEASIPAIRAQLRSLHLPIHKDKPKAKPRPPLTEEEEAILTEMFEADGAPFSEIAKKLGRPREFIRSRISNLSLVRPAEKTVLNSYAACRLHVGDLLREHPERETLLREVSA